MDIQEVIPGGELRKFQSWLVGTFSGSAYARQATGAITTEISSATIATSMKPCFFILQLLGYFSGVDAWHEEQQAR